MTTVPNFSPDQPPSVVVAAAGEWLAAQIGDGARYLRSKRDVVRKVAGRAAGIGLQTSSWSRTGQGTWISPRIWVTDAHVNAWQKEHPLAGLFTQGGYIFSTLIVNLGLRGTVELVGPLRSAQPATTMSLPEFWATLAEDVLPTSRLLWGAPAAAAELLPDRWLGRPEPLFWWAVAYGDKGAALTVLSRYFLNQPRSREHFDAGRRLAGAGVQAPVPVSNVMIALGWSAVTSGALGADEPV